MKEWNRNKKSAFVTNGCIVHSLQEREENDFYATDPKALELFLNEFDLHNKIWECACGKGQLSKVLKNRGYEVVSTDLIDRGYGKGNVDFLNCKEKVGGVDILTNPPYKKAQEFVEHSLELIDNGMYVVMFLKLTFLEGKGRKEMFKKYPPKYVYVSSGRCVCAINGDFEKAKDQNAIAYAWYVWEKGFKGEPTIRWFN